MKLIPLYHWSPVARRKQIIRYGLRPGMRPCIQTPGWKAPYICFADTPSWAWALSGDLRWAPSGEWDLWMVWSNRLISPRIYKSKERPSGIQEVRTDHRVFKRDLWYVGSRMKP